MEPDELRERISASRRKIGLSFDEALETTVFSTELLNQYLSADTGTHGVAAFRFEAFLTAPQNRPIADRVLATIAEGLRRRLSDDDLNLVKSDLLIGLRLFESGHFDSDGIAALVDALKGVDDFSVASLAPTLLRVIGTDFIQDYLTSTELFETGGMGGSMRPLVREMATQALTDFERETKTGRTSR